MTPRPNTTTTAAVLISALLFTSWLSAQSTALAQLQNTLSPLRADPYANSETRGATPVLATAKRQLREFIESRMARLSPKDNETTFTRQLNADLKNADLFCSKISEGCTSPDFSALGFLGEVQIHFLANRSIVVLQTAIGVQCGYDESAYLYEWRQSRWQRVWESEQNNYKENEYRPQTIQKVLVSDPATRTGERLVLTLGTSPWCSSNWRGVFYRAWRVGQQSKLLLDESEVGYLGYDPPIDGRVSAGDFFVEFRMGSLDINDVHNRETIRHFVVEGDHVVRTHPVARNPRNFVEEWLTQSWQESSNWSDNGNPSLATWHQRLHDRVHGGFSSPTQRCGDSSDLWQVSATLDSDTYFIVRWQSPDQFTMSRISNEASAACTREHPEVDETLSK